MKVFKRIVTPEKAKEHKAAFESCSELAHIKKSARVLYHVESTPIKSSFNRGAAGMNGLPNVL